MRRLIPLASAITLLLFAPNADAQSITQCRVTTSAPTYTTGTNNPLSCNTSGGLRIDDIDSPVADTVNNEDTASANADPLIAIGIKRMDTPVSGAGAADLDYINAIADSFGRIWTDPQGNVASGATDSGNPLKIGGKYNSTTPTFTDGQRGDIQIDSRGNARVVLTNTDGIGGQLVGTAADGGTLVNSARTEAILKFYNGTTMDLWRGTAADGAEVQGGVASGVADTGNPVKIGGIYKTTPDTLTDGQRGNVSLTDGGTVKVAITDGTAANTTVKWVQGNSDSQASTTVGLLSYTRPQVFDGTDWDRLRGSGSGDAYVTQGPYSYSRKTADGQVKATAGFVHTVCFEPTTATPTAGLISIYDSATETGTVVLSKWFFATNPGQCETLDATFGTAIFVGYDAAVTNMSVTVTYR